MNSSNEVLREARRQARNKQDRLNDVKDATAKEILARHSIATIRSKEPIQPRAVEVSRHLVFSV
jgi:hypothetical protein